MNGTINDEVKAKCSNATGFEYQKNASDERSPLASPTQNASSPIIPNKPVTKRDIISLSNSQTVPISSQNSPSSPLKNESSITVCENIAKTSPEYSGKQRHSKNQFPHSEDRSFDFISIILTCRSNQFIG